MATTASDYDTASRPSPPEPAPHSGSSSTTPGDPGTSQTTATDRLTTMPDNTHQDARVRRVLRSGAETAVPDWTAARAGFPARALSDDLVDIAYEDHDTPLGTMRVSATHTGIVRLILPAEDAEEVLQDLARKGSARILRTGTPAITQTREEGDEYFDG